jgi:hypothetical protein
MYERRSGTTVDGVIDADPVVLAYLPRATRSAVACLRRIPDRDHAVRALLADAYARMVSTADKDRYVATAATDRRPAITSPRRLCDARHAPELWVNPGVTPLRLHVGPARNCEFLR